MNGSTLVLSSGTTVIQLWQMTGAETWTGLLAMGSARSLPTYQKTYPTLGNFKNPAGLSAYRGRTEDQAVRARPRAKSGQNF